MQKGLHTISCGKPCLSLCILVYYAKSDTNLYTKGGNGMAEKACTNCRENCKNFATQDIIEYCREHFEISDTVSDQTVREKIKSVLGAERWAAAEVQIRGRKTFRFTHEELQQIVFQTPLYDYLLERASERARTFRVQGMPFRDWVNHPPTSPEGWQMVASKLMDLVSTLCMQVYGEGLLPPLPPPPAEIEEKADAIFEVFKQGLMFYPQFADMFGGESVKDAKTEDERQAERIADLVAEKLRPILTTPPPKAEPRPQNKHRTFGE